MDLPFSRKPRSPAPIYQYFSPPPGALPQYWWYMSLTFYAILFLVDGFILPFPLEPDCSDVSGFFGPGAYLAWYITNLSLIMKNAPEDISLRRHLFRSINGRSFSICFSTRLGTSPLPPGPKILAVDSDAIASITYPTIAAACLLVQTAQKDAAQALAGLFVLRRCLDFVFIAEIFSIPLSVENIIKAARSVVLVPLALG